jgi:ribose transport system substrate-binding protein
MKTAARILAVIFGLVLIVATIINADLVRKSALALSKGVYKESPVARTERFHVIVAIPDTDDSYFRGLVNGIKESATSAEAAIQIFRYSATSEADAERYFNLAMDAKVDGLIMFTSRNDPIEARTAIASKDGVAFVPICTDPPTFKGQFFVGSDSLRQGFESASLVLGKLGDSARIGIILPPTGSENLAEEPFYNGVDSATKIYPGAKIVSVIRARPGALSGEESAASMLRRKSPVNAIICSSARDTIGAAQVVIDMNVVGKVIIVGTDETPEIRKYVDNGVILASIVRDSISTGKSAIEAFTRLREGKKTLKPIESGFFVYKGGENQR